MELFRNETIQKLFNSAKNDISLDKYPTEFGHYKYIYSCQYSRAKSLKLINFI